MPRLPESLARNLGGLGRVGLAWKAEKAKPDHEKSSFERLLADLLFTEDESTEGEK